MTAAKSTADRLVPPRSALRLVALLGPTALYMACAQPGHDSQDADLAIVIDTIADVVRVTNTGPAPEWRLVPVVSIGPKTIAEQGAGVFGTVAAVTWGPDGNLFVADGMNLEVKVFGLNGKHRHTFGRHGEGPGEFQSLYSLAWVGDRLLTLDPRQGRIGEFSKEGEFLGQRRIRLGGASGSPAFIRFFPVGANEVFRLHSALAVSTCGSAITEPAKRGTPFPSLRPRRPRRARCLSWSVKGTG